jgi:hypothetical protein
LLLRFLWWLGRGTGVVCVVMVVVVRIRHGFVSHQCLSGLRVQRPVWKR